VLAAELGQGLVRLDIPPNALIKLTRPHKRQNGD